MPHKASDARPVRCVTHVRLQQPCPAGRRGVDACHSSTRACKTTRPSKSRERQAPQPQAQSSAIKPQRENAQTYKLLFLRYLGTTLTFGLWFWRFVLVVFAHGLTGEVMCVGRHTIGYGHPGWIVFGLGKRNRTPQVKVCALNPAAGGAGNGTV